MKKPARKPRKPKPINHTQRKVGDCYASMFEKGRELSNSSGEPYVAYIGGSSYEEWHQIHLSAAEVHRLAIWLSKASAYLKEVR